MPVGLSRHAEISSHGFPPQTSDFFAVHNGEITFSASVPVQFNAAGERGGMAKIYAAWGRDRTGPSTLDAAVRAISYRSEYLPENARKSI